MKKVRLRTLMAGPDGVFAPGSVIELTDAAARHLLETGQAGRVAGKTPVSHVSPTDASIKQSLAPKAVFVKTAQGLVASSRFAISVPEPLEYEHRARVARTLFAPGSSRRRPASTHPLERLTRALRAWVMCEMAMPRVEMALRDYEARTEDLDRPAAPGAHITWAHLKAVAPTSSISAQKPYGQTTRKFDWIAFESH